MNGFPLWAVPLCTAFAGSLVVAALLWWGERRDRPGIDMTGLTNDDRAAATAEETLERAERLQVDPSKFTTGEIQNLHRMLAAEMATAPSALYVPSSWTGRYR